jgi:hypothetical protein
MAYFVYHYRESVTYEQDNHYDTQNERPDALWSENSLVNKRRGIKLDRHGIADRNFNKAKMKLSSNFTLKNLGAITMCILGFITPLA